MFEFVHSFFEGKKKVVKNPVLISVLLLLIMGIIASSSYIQPVKAEEWVGYVPYPQEVDLAFCMVNETAYVKVTITYPVIALNVSDWGVVLRNGSDFRVNAQVWLLISDVYLPMVQVLSHTYDLGYLESGSYTFTFSAWGVSVKDLYFIVGLVGDINHDGGVDMKDVYIQIQAFCSYPGHPRWNPQADITGSEYLVPDGKVDMRDIYVTLQNFGTEYP